MADTTELKIDIASLKKDIKNVNTINGRLDTAIDKLTDVSTCVKSIILQTYTPSVQPAYERKSQH